jgi:hypothetical protein
VRYLLDRPSAQPEEAGIPTDAAPVPPVKQTSPIPVAVAPKHFRLMDLPTELRLIIAEYALSYEEGLRWEWKCPMIPGKMVGFFKDRATSANGRPIYRDDPTTRLCISRQLRNETSRLWAKCKTTTLYFDGILQMPGIEHGNVFNAVEACRYFIHHKKTGQLARTPSLALEGKCFSYMLHAMMNLSSFTWFKPELNIRVIERLFAHIWVLDQQDAQRFWSVVEKTSRCIQRCEELPLPRVWKVYPSEIRHRYDLERLRLYLTAAEFEVVRKFIDNGM